MQLLIAPGSGDDACSLISLVFAEDLAFSFWLNQNPLLLPLAPTLACGSGSLGHFPLSPGGFLKQLKILGL